MSRASLQHWRKRLSRQRGPQFWRSLEELSRTESFLAFLSEEFPRWASLLDVSVDRRQTLKLMAASMALTGLTACRRQPREHLVPYVDMPEHMVPGNARYYATAAVHDGYAHGLLAESHEGRPTKLEGLPAHPATLGACDSLSQASVLSLYDPDRSQALRHRGRVAGFDALLKDLEARRHDWDRNGGRGLRLLTGTVTSPSQTDRINELLARWPEARWHAFEPVDRESVFAGSETLFGRELEPVYRFDRARVIVSLDADFLHGPPGFLRYAHDFASRRRPVDVGRSLSRLYALESTPGLTGAAADHVLRRPYPRIEAVARQLAHDLGLDVSPPGKSVAPAYWIEALVADLRRNRGAVLVVPGDQQPPAVHALAHAMNHALDAPGNTLIWIEPVPSSRRAHSLSGLVEAIHDNAVGELVMLDTNPAYTAPADLGFREALESVPWSLHWSTHHDETGRLSTWHVPAAHALEGWGDARAFDGTVSLVQPLIRPLANGRTSLQVLAALTEGRERNARNLLRDFWREHHGEQGFEAFWQRGLHDGMVADTASPAVETAPRADWARRLPEEASGTEDDALVLQFAPDPVIWDGRHANNGWLQELPRPLTKLTWDNALLIAPALAGERRLDSGDMVRVTSGERSLELPVLVMPGQPEGAVTVHLGHGRTAAGRVADGVGSNAYRLRTRAAPWAAPATIQPVGAKQPLAVTQHHHAIEGRDLVRGASLQRFLDEPGFARGQGPETSLYPEPWPARRESPNAWGMSIDLSACIGCNACITACQSENNIPIVGREEVRRGHDMHWIRVDRYFEGPPEAPALIFQPVPCMHCENAPCEYVCPVGATQHSASGLNEMIYQRCVGTRYCSQNCPYKVRRFNWFDYTSAEAEYADPKAVRNPDVSVRPRGVMEKCTYCVQRINAARIEADANDRPIEDGGIQTACQQACPTQAIVFGDLNDPGSEVVRRKSHPLDYAMLEELNTRPRTTYLAAVRNPNPDIGEEET